MEPDALEILNSPIVQWGFAGMCGILLAIIVWLIQKLLNVIDCSNRVIGDHNEIYRESICMMKEMRELQIHIKDDLYRRPCLKDRA